MRPESDGFRMHQCNRFRHQLPEDHRKKGDHDDDDSDGNGFRAKGDDLHRDCLEGGLDGPHRRDSSNGRGEDAYRGDSDLDRGQKPVRLFLQS